MAYDYPGASMSLDLSVFDITDPATITLDGQPLGPGIECSISRGRTSPDGPITPVEVYIGGQLLENIRVVRGGNTVAVIPGRTVTVIPSEEGAQP